MKETGIIMSGNHPKLILDGLKTMPRRVIVPNYEAKGCENSDIVKYCNIAHKGYYMFEVWSHLNTKVPLPLMVKCPYGGVGDRLWVRESFYTESGDVWYKADGQTAPMLIKWKSSMFMPRWASRILLEITEVRGERLQEIGLMDATAEGISPYTHNVKYNVIDTFRELWDSLNAKRGYGWEVNPWVWVISFRQMGI